MTTKRPHLTATNAGMAFWERTRPLLQLLHLREAIGHQYITLPFSLTPNHLSGILDPKKPSFFTEAGKNPESKGTRGAMGE
jgi:hypothetical protein